MGMTASGDRSNHTAPTWTPIRGGRASEKVVEQIRAAFFRGMRPGDWLGTETELAERFGVSRLTIRDAVRTLEAQGIVDVKVGARGGLRIADSDPDRFSEALAVQVHLLGVPWEEIAEAMRAVEPTAARLAALRRDDADLERLEHLVKEQHDALGDGHRFHVAASEFHLALAKASRNRALFVAARALRINHDRLLEPEAKPPITRVMADEHAELLAAVRAGDGDLAERLMSRHLDKIAEHG
jgi:DNA-binding FadR family transcriptional regulator